MTTFRAALAVVLLGGYWAARVLVPTVLAVTTALLWSTAPGWGAAALTAITLLAVTLGVRAARVVRGCLHREPVGAVVAPIGESVLWREARAASARLGVRCPEEIRIGDESAFEVWEQPGSLGLVAGPRHLCVGLPLLAGLTAPQLRSLLTHELAHDSREAGRLPAVCHRTRAALGRALDRRPRAEALVFAFWARLFLALEAPVSIGQERRADRAAVWVSGRSAAAAALRELPVLALAWQRYVTEVIAPAASAGYAPLSLSDGFGHSCASWRDELAALRASPPEESRERWDAHPARVERLHAIDVVPEPRLGSGPALPGEILTLRPTSAAAVRQVEGELLGEQVRRVPWEEFQAITASQPLRDEVTQLYRAAAAAARIEGPAGLDTVLRLLEERRADDMVAGLEPPRRATARRLLAVAFSQAAVDGGLARWRRAESGALRVVRPDGGAVPVEELAARAIADPDTVSMVRDVLRLVGHSRTDQFV
ncbi:MAG: hypothetical protein GEU94_12530 [Micromonosporaceae bacterium]|nr:hypothetical protein [Micromonosporaceae bacterium]